MADAATPQRRSQPGLRSLGSRSRPSNTRSNTKSPKPRQRYKARTRGPVPSVFGLPRLLSKPAPVVTGVCARSGRVSLSLVTTTEPRCSEPVIEVDQNRGPGCGNEAAQNSRTANLQSRRTSVSERSEWRLRVADSTGRCNGFMKSLSGCFEV